MEYLTQPFLINQYLYVLQLIQKDCSKKRKSKKRRAEIEKYIVLGKNRHAEIRFVY